MSTAFEPVRVPAVRHESTASGAHAQWSESGAALAGVRVEYHGDPVVAAGSLTRFRIDVTANAPIAPGAEIGFARRWPSDWGTPQSSAPSQPDFVEVSAAPGRNLRWWNARLHPWHPFDHVLFVALPEGLDAGETLRVEFGGGDGSQTAAGFTAQTFVEEASPLAVRMRIAADAPWVELARPAIRIAGNVAHRLVLTAPSRVSVGQPFEVHLRVEDRWGNPSTLGSTVRIDAPASLHLRIPDSGWVRATVTLARPGIHRLTAVVDEEGAAVAGVAARSPGDSVATAGNIFAATSNPIEVVDGALDTLLCWGDLHAQSVIGCGARSIDAYHRHARDFAATDFGSHQANCFLVSNAEWAETQQSTAGIHEDGRFVTLLGVEWSAASAYGGDHNLYFPGDAAELHRCSHEFVADKSDAATDLPHVEDLYRHYRGTGTLVAVHVGGRTADLRWHEPTLERLIEVHSTHATSEWFLLDALKRGYRMGVISGSDSVDGRPGASHPGHMGVRNVRGGLTAVAMPALTRAALWSSLHARHCYGTTGARMLLRLSAGGAQAGDELRTAQLPAFDLRVEGTAPLESVDFFRDDTMLESVDLLANAGALSNAIRIGWRGTTTPGNWQRARMLWTGELRVSGARIVDVQPWALDTPDEGILGHDDRCVRFRSITAGDWDGLVLTLDDIAHAELKFVTGPMTLHARLHDLGAGARTFDVDSPARTLELRRLPQAAPALGWRGCFTDRNPPPGDHAYWIRVRQTDGELGWSTPVFTTLEAA